MSSKWWKGTWRASMGFQLVKPVNPLPSRRAAGRILPRRPFNDALEWTPVTKRESRPPRYLHQCHMRRRAAGKNEVRPHP